MTPGTGPALADLLSPFRRPDTTGPGPDWRTVWPVLEANLMGGWVHSRVKSGEIPEPPEPANRGMREAFRISQFANLTLLAEAGRILKESTNGGIRLVPVKGLAFLERLYPGLGGRRMGDLDFLIHPDARDQVTGLLESLGYIPKPLAPGTTAIFFSRRQGSIEYHIDLNWRLSRNDKGNVQRGIPAEEWERGLVARTIAGVDTKVLGLEEQLLMLVNHVVVHDDLTGLNNLVDISLLLMESSGLDWEKLEDRARLWGLRKNLHLVIGLLGDWWGAPVPGAYTRRWDSFRKSILRTPAAVFLEADWVYVQGGRAAPTGGQDGHLRVIARFWLRYLVTDTMADRITFLLHAALPSVDRIAKTYRITNRPTVLILRMLHAPLGLAGIVLLWAWVRVGASIKGLTPGRPY